MSLTETLADPARRNVAVLAGAQALFHCTQVMAIATTPLAAYSLLGADAKIYATVPIFLTHFALMATTLPAALLMGRIGRRPGFSIGALSGICGGLVSFFGIWWQSFPLLCLGGMLQGASAAFAWHYRFAATDMASPEFRAKAVSLVMAGGIVAGLAGPQLAKWGVALFQPVLFAGVYLGVALLSALMLLLVQAVRIPAPAPAAAGDGGRSMREIARQPAFLIAVLAAMIGYAVMTLVMSATPLAMQACGFGFGDSATVIQVHVLAMFVPSFFTGHLINRFGVHRILAAGAIIEIGCALVNLHGISFWHFTLANLLVGLGWNFCYVGGTTLLTTTYTPAERAKVQGTNDFLVYASTALAAGASGTLQATAGWSTLNSLAIPALCVRLAGIAWLAMVQNRAASTARST
jgi:MFS family permease